MTPEFPSTFFVAYKLFLGKPFPPEGIWGDILDGPVTNEDELIDKILEAFKDNYGGLNSNTLKVWFVTPNTPAENCTDWALNAIEYRVHVNELEEDY